VRYALAPIVAAEDFPVTLAEVKSYLRLEEAQGDENAILEAFVKSAQSYLDGPNGVMGHALTTQTWDFILDAFPWDDYIPLPLPPLQSVASIKYVDTDGVETTLAASEYSVDTESKPGRVILKHGKSWPTVSLNPMNPIKVRFVAGYNAALAEKRMPGTLKAAFFLLVAHSYENRAVVTVETAGQAREIPFAITSLLWPLRFFFIWDGQ